jgi:enoyl-[acyl-carrier protein] reductase I
VGQLDFVVHAIAFADKDELAADFRFRDTSLENFTRSLQISCWSFIDVARRAPR